MSPCASIVLLVSLSASLGALVASAATLGLDKRGTTKQDTTHPYCLSCTGTRYQLIRGEDEELLCNERLYCDCQLHVQNQCEYFQAFNPDANGCAWGFNCVSWFRDNLGSSTTQPGTPGTPTAQPGTPGTSTTQPGTLTTQPGTPGTPTSDPGTPGTPSGSGGTPTPNPDAKANSAWASSPRLWPVLALSAALFAL